MNVLIYRLKIKIKNKLTLDENVENIVDYIKTKLLESEFINSINFDYANGTLNITTI